MSVEYDSVSFDLTDENVFKNLVTENVSFFLIKNIYFLCDSTALPYILDSDYKQNLT